MAQQEYYGERDQSYSAWHRFLSIRRFTQDSLVARSLSMIDIDAIPYVEYDDRTKEPLFLIETAVDVGQKDKASTIITNLAKRAQLDCYVVLYTKSNDFNPVDPKVKDISSFRVKQTYPIETPFCSYSPYGMAVWLRSAREKAIKKLAAKA